MTKLTTATFAAVTHTVFGVLIDAKPVPPLNGTPDGHIYAQLMELVDHRAYSIIRDIWLDKKWVTRDNHLLRITDAGVSFFKELDAVYSKHKPLTGKPDCDKLSS
jgi:hypothetical protein